MFYRAKCSASAVLISVSVVNYGAWLAGGGDSVTGAVTLRSAGHFLSVGGQFFFFCVLHSSHRPKRPNKQYSDHGQSVMSSLEYCNGKKREYKKPTLINTALRQMVAMLQPQVGAQHSQCFLVLARRLFFHKDYIVAATIISFPSPLLYAIATAMTFTWRFIYIF